MKKIERFYKNKVVWITDASCGIGEAMAYQLSEMGARLILTGGDEQALMRVRSTCKSDCAILPLSLSDYQRMLGITERAMEAYGVIDLLINNNALDTRSLLLDTADPFFNSHIHTMECHHLMDPLFNFRGKQIDGQALSKSERIKARMKAWVSAMDILSSAASEREETTTTGLFAERIATEFRRLISPFYTSILKKTS